MTHFLNCLEPQMAFFLGKTSCVPAWILLNSLTRLQRSFFMGSRVIYLFQTIQSKCVKEKELSKKRQCKSWATKGRADGLYKTFTFLVPSPVWWLWQRIPLVLQEESISFSLYILWFFQVLFWDHTGEPGVLWISLEGQMLFTSSGSPVPYCQ